MPSHSAISILWGGHRASNCAAVYSLALLFLTAALAWAQPGEADRAFARAVQLHQAGDLDAAAREYQSAIAAEPGRFDARSNLGAVFAGQGRYQEAVAQYREALKSAPAAASGHLRLNLALAYYKSFQITQAADELARLHADEPDNLNATLLLADCRLRTGQFKRVAELLLPLEASQPENRALTYMLGMALIRDGEVAQGQRRIDEILRDGDSAEGRFLLAAAMFMARDYPSAVKGFARAIELNPKTPSLQSFYGQALLLTGDADGAAAAFRKELNENPNDYEANLRLGEILAQRGETGESGLLLQRAARLRPMSAVAGDVSPEASSGEGGVAIGAAAPDFELIGLKRYRAKKPVLLLFGSYTCPQFRGSSAALNALSAKYRERVGFVLIYIREAHAEDQWQSTINEREGVALRPARDLAEKRQHASVCVRKLNIGFPVVVDGMDGAMETAYDAWPSRVYLVGRDGRIAYSSRLGEQSFSASRLDAAIGKALENSK